MEIKPRKFSHLDIYPIHKKMTLKFLKKLSKMGKVKMLAWRNSIELLSLYSKNSVRFMVLEVTSLLNSIRTFSTAQTQVNILQACTVGSLCSSQSNSLSLPSKVSKSSFQFGVTIHSQKSGTSGLLLCSIQKKIVQFIHLIFITSMDAASASVFDDWKN